jgi:hypothetical protein
MTSMISGRREVSFTISGIHATQCGFIEILAIAGRLGYRIRQVPIHWHDDGESRLELVSGNLRNLSIFFASG